MTFGVSGLLYKANVLMYDRQSESLWSQALRRAVAGPLTGRRLEVLPSTVTSWEKWRKRHPDTEVLSLNTGYHRDYDHDPYAAYYESRSGFFSFFTPGPGEEEKELVAGVELDGQTRAYPLELLRTEGRLRDRFGERRLEIVFDQTTDMLTIQDGEGNNIPHVVLYWFVWKGMHPETSRYGGK